MTQEKLPHRKELCLQSEAFVKCLQPIDFTGFLLLYLYKFFSSSGIIVSTNQTKIILHGGKFMSMKCTQISLPDVFHNCQDMFLSSSPTFFSLLEENIDISDFIPLEFIRSIKPLIA